MTVREYSVDVAGETYDGQHRGDSAVWVDAELNVRVSGGGTMVSVKLSTLAQEFHEDGSDEARRLYRYRNSVTNETLEWVIPALKQRVSDDSRSPDDVSVWSVEFYERSPVREYELRCGGDQ